MRLPATNVPAVSQGNSINDGDTHKLPLNDMTISTIDGRSNPNIVARAQFNGPIWLRVGREEDVLGMELAKSLWVT